MWTTYSLTTLIEQLWNQEKACLGEEHAQLNLAALDICAASEHALNFMLTEHAKVIATSMMNPLWIGPAIIRDDLPSFNPRIFKIGQLNLSLHIGYAHWPRNGLQG